MIRFGTVYKALFADHGPQRWWPTEDAFEIAVGTLLVQRTNWRNVELALGRLKQAELLSVRALAAAEPQAIEECVRSAGFFRSKATRLRKLAAFIQRAGGIGRLAEESTPGLRAALLAQDGIGPESADVILLYAFGRPAVVVDEYLRRLARRWIASPVPIADEALRAWVGRALTEASQLSEFHALVVTHGKAHCGKQPRCKNCPLRLRCRTGGAYGIRCPAWRERR